MGLCLLGLVADLYDAVRVLLAESVQIPGHLGRDRRNRKGGRPVLLFSLFQLGIIIDLLLEFPRGVPDPCLELNRTDIFALVENWDLNCLVLSSQVR